MSRTVSEPSSEVDKLSYEIFSILESKFLFGITETVTGKTPPGKQSSAGGEGFGRGKIRVLCIDGGGAAAGIIAGKALSYLEATLRRKTSDPEARIADYIDVVAGSGIGGILASMLFTDSGDGSRPLFHADETWSILVDRAGDFFPRRPGIFHRIVGGSPASKLDGVLRRLFLDKTLKDTLKPVLIPCYDLSNSVSLLFSRADAMETDGYDFRIRDVCRAAASNPAVMPPVEIRSMDGQTRCVGVDGGMVMNNPTAAAITHVLNNKQEFPFVSGVEDLVVLSLGAGDTSPAGCHSGNRNQQPTASHLMKIAGDGVSDLVDQTVSMVFGLNRATNYARVQGTGVKNGKLPGNLSSRDAARKLSELADEVLAQKNVESVLFRGRKVTERTNLETLDWFADELVREHARRKCRSIPTVVFKQPQRLNPSSPTSSR